MANITDMIITLNREKLLNAIVYFARSTKYCSKIKLLKLLYLLDFLHFKQTGKSLTGLEYFAWDMGLVPKDLFEELSGSMKPDMKATIKDLPAEGFQKIQPTRKFDRKYFSDREMKLLGTFPSFFRMPKQMIWLSPPIDAESTNKKGSAFSS